MNNTKTASRYGIVAKGASVLLTAALLASSFSFLGSTFAAPEVDAATDYGLMETPQEGVILHAWEWSFNNIKANMAKIAEAGYTSVQTSVIQQAKEGTKGKTNEVWWVYYQPANFTIDNTGNSALGTKAEFAAMCEEAHKYGIHVIVDVVANHLGNASGYDKAAAIPSDIKDDSSCWHDLWNQEINYGSRYSITHGSMGGLPDLNSESTKIQNYVKTYLRECIDCGADGFRFDAAKHIGVPNDTDNAGGDFWPNVLNDAYSYYKTKGYYSSGLYCYGEILYGTGGPAVTEYTQYMSVTDDQTGNGIRGNVASGNASAAATSYYNLGAAADKTVLWAESHDTYSNDSKESTYVSDSNINKTWALVGSRNKATALYFARTAGWRGGYIGDICSTQCFNKEVVEVNKFHNYFNGESEYIASSGSIAYNERGTSGVVLVNCSGGSTSVSVTANKMAAGTYTDQVSGNTFTVANGKISGQIGDTGIAVVYNAVPVTKSAIVSATPAGGSFTDTVTATLSVKNADSGSYTTSDGKSGTYTNGQTVTFGSGVSVGGTVTLTVSATGEDGVKKTETYTYTKKDPSAVTTIYFDNSSYNWSNVYVYVYNKSGSSSGGGESGGGGSSTTSGTILFSDALGWGNVNAYFFSGTSTVGTAWPGTAMTKTGTNEYNQGQYSISIPSGATSVIFNNGSAQTVDITLSNVTGYYCTGAQENGKYTVGSWTSSGASSVTCNAAWPGVKMTLDASTGYYMYEVPDNLVNGYAIFSDGTDTASKRYPADGEDGMSIGDSTKLFAANHSWTDYTPVTPTKDPTVTCNKSTGTSFTTETLDITLTLANAVSGTYSVDGGPTKTFTSSKTVTIGEGKIGDSTVTVETTATNSEGTTKSYTFTFNKKYVVKTTSSGAAALDGKYATNPNGQKGANKTITKASDFTDSMIIAQGVANDDPRIFRGSHEAPVYDTYALYAAWDDTNLYLGWQFTNVTDVVDPAQGYPISDNGKPWNGDIPQMLAFDLGTGKSADMSAGTMAGGKYVWGLKVGFDTDVDALMCFSSKPKVGQPSLFKIDGTGYFTYDEDYITGFTAGNVVLQYEDGFIGTNGITGINSNGYAGYKPADLQSSSSAWVDFTTKGHDKAQDTFYWITIPLNTLGITKSYLESTGIGVMHISTFGEGGISSIPMDMTMLDNATEPYSADESTSAEKEDTDVISVPLARIGAGTGTGGGGSTTTTALQANFGTDKSAPQLTTTALTLKAIGMGGTAPYTYTFKVDGSVVKADNSTATYSWTPATAGQHTISCIIKDSTGATATTEKTFTAEGSDATVAVTSVSVSPTTVSVAVGGTASVTATVAPSNATNKTITWTSSDTSVATVTDGTIKGVKAGTATVTAKSNNGKTATVAVTVTGNNSGSLVNNSTTNSERLTVGSKYTFNGAASGGTAPYKYTYSYKRTTSAKWTALATDTTKDSMYMTPSSVGTFDVKITVKDSKNATAEKTFSLTVVDGLSRSFSNTSTVSSNGIAPSTKFYMYGSATGSSGYKYAYYYKRTTARSWTVIGTEFGSDTELHFTPRTEGEFNVKIDIMDKNGDIVSKQFAMTVNSKYAASALVNNSSISSSFAVPGTQLVLTGAASGSSGYKYAFYYKKAQAANWSTIGTEYGTATTAKITLKNAGVYVFKVDVKNASGNVTAKGFSVEIAEDAGSSTSGITNNSKISASSITAGSKVTITGAATGGTAPYTYSYYQKKSTNSVWNSIGDEWISDTSSSLTLRTAGVYDIKVTVKDSTGATADKTFAVVVN